MITVIDMKKFLIFLIFFNRVSADCDHNCSCPSLRSYYFSNPNVITYEEGPGCSQSFTCTELNHFAYFLKDSSTVPGIQDEWSAWLSNGTQTDFSLPTTTKEFVSSFGLVCENSTWYATKFPFGIFSLGSLRLSSDETNGKGYRAKIRSLGC